jgi:hypothetical protein
MAERIDADSVKMLGYFDQQVLASYRNEPHKYTLASDYFEGTLTVTDEYYRELEAANRTEEYINIRFGYRALGDGSLALVVWLPDLFEKSKTHVPKWAAFHLKHPTWSETEDGRFQNWFSRYVEGSWDVDNGPLFYLGDTMQTVNGLTSELVGIPLYQHEIDLTLGYPAAENTHRYQDAHKALYGYFIDGIDKACIEAVAKELGRDIKIRSKKTVEGLAELFPMLGAPGKFSEATATVSRQRRLASHSVRPKAQNFPAFSTFTKDLRLCVEAVKEVLSVIEKDSGLDGKEARKRHEARKWLPIISRPPSAHFSIVQARQMAGKTVEKIEIGFREDIKNVHGSEAMIIYFTDGSIMGLDTGSNVGNIVNDENGMRPDEFHVDFNVSWVPERPQKRAAR